MPYFSAYSVQIFVASFSNSLCLLFTLFAEFITAVTIMITISRIVTVKTMIALNQGPMLLCPMPSSYSSVFCQSICSGVPLSASAGSSTSSAVGKSPSNSLTVCLLSYSSASTAVFSISFLMALYSFAKSISTPIIIDFTTPAILFAMLLCLGVCLATLCS